MRSCSARSQPCSRPGRPWTEDGTVLRLAGSGLTFTITQVQAHYDPADWYPQDHPANVPDIVAKLAADDLIAIAAYLGSL